jgi:hypothetical protein
MNHSFSFLSALAPAALLIASVTAQNSPDPAAGAVVRSVPQIFAPAPATDDPAYGLGGGNASTTTRTTNFLGSTNAIDFVAGSGSCGANSDQSIGWQFNVTSPITVNQMSWFDEAGNGLGVSHQVGIWTPGGTLIASTNVTIPAGTAATLNGGWRVVNITPTVLPIGSGYIVGGYNGSGSTDCLSFNVSQTVHPDITYIDATFSGINGIFERPTSFSAANNGFYGVGFTIDTGGGGCQANGMDFVAGSGSCGTNQDQSVGWQFDVTTPITVNRMSWFDEGGNGLSVAHQVGIWNPAGALIASTNVTIPSGTGATLDGNYRTVSITPTLLPVGNGYIVGGYNGSGSTDCLSANVTQTPHPNINYVDATFSGLNGIFERPASFSAANNGFYGPGFQVDCGGGNCDPIDIGGFDSSRGRPLSSVGTLGYDTVRAGLANSANFGANGTVCCPTNLVAETATATAAYLAGLDVFFAGDGTGTVSAAEGAALQAFHAGGGNIIVIGDSGSNLNMANSILAAVAPGGMQLGATGCASSTTDGVIAGGNEVGTGPFGNLGGGTFATTLTSGITLNGATAVVTCTSTGTVNMAIHPAGSVNGGGSGCIVALGDAGWFDLFTNAAGSIYNPNNVLTALNAFASACGGGGGGPITVICDPANNHTQGNYTKLDNSSLGGGGGSGLHLEATDGPAGEFGYFLVSTGANLSLPVSNGILCLDAPQGRYAPAAGAALNSVGQFNGAGVYQSTVQAQQGWDVPSVLPSPPGGSIGAGDTWYFQMWYRDGNRSNFSNAICVQF